MEPGLRIDGGVIRVANGRGRGQSVVLGVLAAGFALVALLPPAVLDDLHIEIAGRLPVLGVAALCLSAAFWWSEVTIDPAADTVVIARRWGPWRSVYRRPLSAFEAVVVAQDSDGDAWAFLAAREERWVSKRNHARSLIWGRSAEETNRMAAALAGRLGLPLKVLPPGTSPFAIIGQGG